jgi:hypothetical protein
MQSNYGGLISQYRMSSGECLLLSLLHFIHNAIIRKGLPNDAPVLMLLDEIELALHPVAVLRFFQLLSKLVDQYPNITVVLTTHAPEAIRKIRPSNMLKLENENGIVNVVSPCYPSYAIRDMYTHDKYDYVILCEDKLAKNLIERLMKQSIKMSMSKLVCVIPVGGWENVLKLQNEINRNNLMGIGTIVFSVLDGDIVNECNQKGYGSMSKLFLPIPSVEKYLYNIIYYKNYKNLKKIINDKYFQVDSLDAIIYKYHLDHSTLPKHNPEKSFYRYLVKDLEYRGISEDVFISYLCDEISTTDKLDGFLSQLEQKLSLLLRD